MFKVNKEECVGCAVCVDVCPASAISMSNGKAEIDSGKCTSCGRCAQVCPRAAIFSDTSGAKVDVPHNQTQAFPMPGFGMGAGPGRGSGRGLGRGFGRGLRKGPRDGRGGGGRQKYEKGNIAWGRIVKDIPFYCKELINALKDKQVL